MDVMSKVTPFISPKNWLPGSKATSTIKAEEVLYENIMNTGLDKNIAAPVKMVVKSPLTTDKTTMAAEQPKSLSEHGVLVDYLNSPIAAVSFDRMATTNNNIFRKGYIYIYIWTLEVGLLVPFKPFFFQKSYFTHNILFIYLNISGQRRLFV